MPRLPRFRRAFLSQPFQLSDRDARIIQLVHRHRFLRSSHLVLLSGGSAQQLLRRLQLLYHHGYLERPRAQLDYYHQGGSRPIVYGLGNKGAALLKDETNIFPEPTRWSQKNRAVGRMFLEHAILVSDVMVALEMACRSSAGVKLITEGELLKASGSKNFRWRVNIGGGITLGVVPDRVFALEFAGPNGMKERQHFFLEADRGTMPVIRKRLAQTSMFRKFLAYEVTWSQSLHRSEFGFSRFRVLTVTSSNARVQSLVDACSKLKRGHGLFLFGHTSLMESPDGLLSALWQTGRPGEASRLMD